MLLIAAVACQAFGSQVSGDQTPSARLQFRARADLVEVQVFVADSAGRFVQGLTADDFRIAEDGRPQTVEALTFVDLPSGPAAPQATDETADVVTNAASDQSRLFTLVLDSLHVAALHTADVRRLATKFIDEHMGSRDRAAVLIVGRPDAGQGYTANKALLRAAVGRFIGEKPRSLTLNRLEDRQRGGEGIDRDQPQRVRNLRDLAAAVREIVAPLGRLSGQARPLLLFSEGPDFDTETAPARVNTNRPDRNASQLFDPGRDRDTVLASLEEVVMAASRSNVPIHAIDPRGAGAFDELIIEMTGDKPPTQDLHQEIRRSQNVLRTFADRTGGRSAVATDGFTAAFDAIVTDASDYYVLGYTSANRAGDGKYRRVSVTVTRPGVTVRARPGYYSRTAPEAGDASSPVSGLTRLLQSPIALPGLGLRATASADGTAQADKVGVTLVVELDGGDLTFRRDGTQFLDTVDLGYVAVRHDGTQVAAKAEAMVLRMEEATHEAVVSRGLRYLAEFTAPPGTYQVRVAAAEREGGREGTVVLDLVVPDARARWRLSPVLLTSSNAGRTPTAGSAPRVRKVLPAPPTAARVFDQTESLQVFSRLHARPDAAMGDAVCDVTIVDAAGREVFRDSAAYTVGELSQDSGVPHVIEIALSGLVPGPHVLSVSLRGEGTEPEVVSVRFHVR